MHDKNDDDTEDMIGQSTITDSIVKVRHKQASEKAKRKTSSKKLYKMISEDPDHEVYGVPPNISYWQMISFMVVISLIGMAEVYLLIIAFVGVMNDIAAAILLLGSLILIIVVSLLYAILEGYLFDKLLVNELGIGKELRGRTLKGHPSRVYGRRALEWEHIDRIDIGSKKNTITAIRMRSGNRELLFSRRYFCREMTFKDIERYIPDFETWKMERTSGNKYDISYIRPIT
ncbi:MAG: hypothetical protein ACFFED_09160 [Candidatus Thorarchaeota archaeon]